MNLYFTGHGEKYAVEQTLLTLFPQERPVYPETPPGGDNELELTFSRGETWCTARAVLRREGRTYTRQCRVRTAALDPKDPVVATRLTRRTLQRAFYLAAVDCLGAEPPWGMLSGVRPVKLPTRAMEAGATPRQAEGMLRDQYHVSPLRRKLAVACAQASRGVQASLAPQEISLYVGIPFCPTRCAYCSFISAAGSANRLIPQYLEALLTEIDAAGAAARQAGKTVRAVYIGGGTPTTLEADQLARLLERVGTAFALAPGTECTVEAGRPDTITREKLLAIRAGGGNRISVNPQTMSDPVLAAIGRSHRAATKSPAPSLFRRRYKNHARPSNAKAPPATAARYGQRRRAKCPSTTSASSKSMMGGQSHRNTVPGYTRPRRRGNTAAFPMASRLGAPIKKTTKTSTAPGRVPVKTADRQLRANA